MLSILNAQYEDEYTIQLEFSDHKKGKVNLKDFIINGHIQPFRVLQDVKSHHVVPVS
jgi:hypothetical protein